MSFVIALSEQTKCVLGRVAEPPQFFHFFGIFFGPRKVVHIDDFDFAFGFTALRNGSKLPNQHQRSLLIVEWLTLYDRAMSVSTSPASRRAIASRR